MVLLYYIPFSNLITGSLYSERKLVTRYKAKLPAYAMTPIWPLIRTLSGFSRDDSGWSLTPCCPHCDSVRLPASLLARKSGSRTRIMPVIDRTGCQPKFTIANRRHVIYSRYRSYASARRVVFLYRSIRSKSFSIRSISCIFLHICVIFNNVLKQINFQINLKLLYFKNYVRYLFTYIDFSIFWTS